MEFGPKTNERITDMEDKYYLISPVGTIEITGGGGGITSVGFVERDVVISRCPASLVDCRDQLAAWFGKRTRTFDLKLDLKGTDFQKRVWDELMTLPYGKTVSYIELSRRLGGEKLTRAVAAANAANPAAIIVPCHRVIGSNGDLTGYRGGVWRKKWLLEFEQHTRQIRMEF